MKRIAVVTRDCAGVNAALRAIVRTASAKNIEVFGIIKGYDGLIDNKFIILNRRSVSGIINRGGTILKTARSQRFYTEEGQNQAMTTLRNNNIDGVIVIGGNGSLTGAHHLAITHHIPVIGVPATIDNDINEVGLSVGADTAVNVALDALDKIRDTATSLERIFIVEVMGRKCGYIALQVALAGGCEEVVVPEDSINLDLICQEIKKGHEQGKKSWMIIVAEGKAHAQDIAEQITEKTGFETRIAVLGHIQRGGAPTAVDRILAARLGNYAVEQLLCGETDKCVALKDNILYVVPLSQAIQPKHLDAEAYIKLIKILT